MSASDKKKLRKEEKLAQLTERQQAEQKEAKQLKRNTVVFVTVVALVLCIGIGLIAYNWYASSGLAERMTTAVEFGDHKLSAAELNYYYIDILNQLSQDWYSMYLLQYEDGFKSTVALDQQQYKDEAGKTWADHFVDEAINEAAGVLAICDEAKKAGYTLSAEEKQEIEDTILALDTQATLSGFGSLTDYLQAMYGNGAQEKTFRTYLENVTLAQSYYTHYTEGLEYTADEIGAKDAETPGYFSAFDYTYYTLAGEDFIEHGEESTEEEHEHSAEELAAGVKQAEAIANELVASGATNKEELDKAIAGLDMYKTEGTEEATEEATEETTEENTEETTEENTEETTEENTEETTEETSEEITEDTADGTNGETEDETAIEQPAEESEEDGEEEVPEETEEETSNAPTSTSYTDYDYSYIPTAIAEWLAAEGREAGKIGSVPYYTTDEEGEPTEEIAGYYVVILDKENKRSENLVTVRHILVEFEGGSADEETGDTVYSDEEKKAASDEAEKIKAEFESGEKTAEAFGELAKKYSADNADAGGLYEDIYPGQMEEGFEDWCFDESRKPGDVGIAETSYGYHVMYYVEKQADTYRDYLITSELRAEETTEWYEGLQDSNKAIAKIGNTSYMNTSIVLSN